MRVLHVIESMGRGGAERNFATLLPALSALGVENVLCTLWGGEAYAAKIAPFARRHDFGLRPGPAFTALPGLIRLAREADVVHTQLPWGDISGRLAALAAGRPTVTTLHTTQYDADNTAQLPPSVQYKVRIIQGMDAMLARTTRRFLAVSPAVRDSYVRALRLPAERIEIAPCVLDPDEFDPDRLPPRDELRARYGMSPQEIAAIYVGRLIPSKRQKDAISAVAEVARAASVKLYLAGTGPDEAELRAQAAALGAPVVFLGDRDDVPRLLHAADLFVFPTLFEGMPVALLEAMAMGKACVCSDLVEIRQLGGGSMAYFPTGDVAALTEALRALVNDPGRRALLGRQAQDLARSYADPRRAAARLLSAAQYVLT